MSLLRTHAACVDCRVAIENVFSAAGPRYYDVSFDIQVSQVACAYKKQQLKRLEDSTVKSPILLGSLTDGGQQYNFSSSFSSQFNSGKI